MCTPRGAMHAALEEPSEDPQPHRPLPGGLTLCWWASPSLEGIIPSSLPGCQLTTPLLLGPPKEHSQKANKN